MPRVGGHSHFAMFDTETHGDQKKKRCGPGKQDDGNREEIAPTADVCENSSHHTGTASREAVSPCRNMLARPPALYLGEASGWTRKKASLPACEQAQSNVF